MVYFWPSDEITFGVSTLVGSMKFGYSILPGILKFLLASCVRFVDPSDPRPLEEWVLLLNVSDWL